jgi:hypothetical protein
MKSEVDRIVDAPGILAACQIEGGDMVVRVPEGSPSRWSPLLEAGRQVLEASMSDEVKIALESQTVVLMRSGEVVLGVVVIKSHPVVKSLKRMLRRAFKRIGGGVSRRPARERTPESAGDDGSNTFPLTEGLKRPF